MSRYKTLGSVAHNFGHSFTSLMNYRDGDYVMGHLLVRARATGAPRLEIDLLAGSIRPEAYRHRSVAPAIQQYIQWFPELVTQHDSSLELIQSATMTVTYDLGREQVSVALPGERSSPYVVKVEIVDDRGKNWDAEFSGWWVPEPQHATLAKRMNSFAGRLANIFNRKG